MRPLFKKSTDELEQLFRECGNSPEQLKILVEELLHRERPKAAALAKKVEAALLQVNPSSPGKCPAKQIV